MTFEPAVKGKALVVDANILVRAVLGHRVLALLERYRHDVSFLTPETAFHEVQSHLPAILTRRGLPSRAVSELVATEILDRLPGLVTPMPDFVYADRESEARGRLSGRDESDWPYVALALGSPIWTEDQDFFGSGVAIWTTNRVEIYLQSSIE